MPRQVEIQSEMITRMLDQTEAGQQIKRNIARLTKRLQWLRFGFWLVVGLAIAGWGVAGWLAVETAAVDMTAVAASFQTCSKREQVTVKRKDQSRIISAKGGKQPRSQKAQP